MKGTILLNYDENFRQVEEEERNKFLRDLLDQMGVPIEDLWEDGKSLSVEQRIKLREILPHFNVQIVDDSDGHVIVYVDKEKVGEFFKSSYKLRQDLSQLDPKKRLFTEMEINFWSIFEE
jgi:hypothetical protein